jgi:dephospho-CoA kinase
MLITVIGRIGSGKDTVAELINKNDKYFLMDTDKIGHSLLLKPSVIDKIIEIFPNVVDNKKINRKKLAELVFPDRIKELNDIMHPLMITKIRSLVRTNTLIHSALPKELALLEISDVVVALNSSDKSIIQRLSAKYSTEHIRKRLQSQNTQEWYNSIANIVLDNNSSYDDLQVEVAKKCKHLI